MIVVGVEMALVMVLDPVVRVMAVVFAVMIIVILVVVVVVVVVESAHNHRKHSAMLTMKITNTMVPYSMAVMVMTYSNNHYSNNHYSNNHYTNNHYINYPHP